MIGLTRFELEKIWGRRSFLLSVCLLVLVNGFLLWYTNLPNGIQPELSAYGKFQAEIHGMTEAEKGELISEFKETMDGLRFVEQVLMMQNMGGDMGDTLSDQARAEFPGMFEAYYDVYQSGTYLRFTDSLWQEGQLADALYEEWSSCAAYGEYLAAVQENKNTLGGIKIFGGAQKESFSSRNVEKSARDYRELTVDQIRWMPEKAVTGSLENAYTDLFLLLSTAFFTGYLILEEKEKGLFSITRTTQKGILPSLWAKLGALLVHCMVSVGLFYGGNLLFYGWTVGFGDLSARLQSLAIYRESCLSISIRQYLMLSIFTKGLVLFGFGTVLAALCIAASRSFLPFIAGGIWYGGSFGLYAMIPGASKGAVLKYLNLAGSLRTENLYGAYLNFNILGQPVSRMVMTLVLIGMTIVTGVSLCIVLFVKADNPFQPQGKHYVRLPFKPHASRFLHECYKITVMNRAALVLLLFGILIGSRNLSHQYNLTVQEQYYQSIMLQLEGELTEEKETLVLAEEARYQQAFAEIERIDEMISTGEISEAVGEDMKAHWYTVTAFYPAFGRVWQQYQHILAQGGRFLYDTGYLYVLGALGDSLRIDLLLLCCGMLLAFGGVMAMEDGKGAWNLLGATWWGKGRILKDKAFACILYSVLLSLVPFVSRIVNISRVFPLRGLEFSVTNIPYCGGFPAWISVAGLVGLLALSQALLCAVATLLILLLSYWRRDPLQAYLYGAVLLAVPLLLGLLGLSFADPFSLYPLYTWTARL